MLVEYGRAEWESLRVQALEDPFSRQGSRFGPHEAVLVGPRFYSVRLVMPDPESEFSGFVSGRLAEFLGCGLPG